jgi:hypothetical protein
MAEAQGGYAEKRLKVDDDDDDGAASLPVVNVDEPSVAVSSAPVVTDTYHRLNVPVKAQYLISLPKNESVRLLRPRLSFSCKHRHNPTYAIHFGLIRFRFRFFFRSGKIPKIMTPSRPIETGTNGGWEEG